MSRKALVQARPSKARWRFQDLPIQRKITSIIIVGMASAMLVTVVNFIIFDRENVTRDLTEEMRVLARITAVRSAVAVAFGDKANALENLTALSIRSSVQHACIYDQSQQLFANYHRKLSPFNSCPASLSESAINATQIMDQLLVVVEPIFHKGKSLGSVLVASDLSPVNVRTRKWILTSILVTIGALLVAFLMTRRMQKAVVNPIVSLSALMDQVKRSNDLSLRAEVQNEDEVGHLVGSFNNMLHILQMRNRDLEFLYQELVDKSTEAESTAASLELNNQMIKDMFSSAAHDLRQPLQAMAIFADTLARKIDAPDQQEVLQKLKQAMRNLSDLFTEVLDVSRYDFDMSMVGAHPIDIQQLVSRLSLEFEAMAEDKHLKLRVHTRPYKVLANGALLERILRNLLSNAIRYTDSGGVLLGCRKRDTHLIIEVWDTGRGIPKEKQKDVFTKFVQVDDEDRSERGGFGLGLAIVKQFSDSLGYKLSLTSVPGSGTVFRLKVPLDLSERTSVTKACKRETKPLPKPSGPLRAKELENLTSEEAKVETRILLIDDSDLVRNSLREALEAWGFLVDDFSDIGSMEDFYRNGGPPPRLIISDFQLGGDVTGEQAILAARAVISTGTPAFIVTGATAPEVLAEVERSGFKYLPKPVKPARLRALVNHYLS